MSEYEVVVHTRVREVYSVDAESAEEALKLWRPEGTLVVSECESVEDVEAPVKVDD